jgi:hypothetical protein
MTVVSISKFLYLLREWQTRSIPEHLVAPFGAGKMRRLLTFWLVPDNRAWETVGSVIGRVFCVSRMMS